MKVVLDPAYADKEINQDLMKISTEVWQKFFEEHILSLPYFKQNDEASLGFQRVVIGLGVCFYVNRSSYIAFDAWPIQSLVIIAVGEGKYVNPPDLSRDRINSVWQEFLFKNLNSSYEVEYLREKSEKILAREREIEKRLKEIEREKKDLKKESAEQIANREEIDARIKELINPDTVGV